MGDLGQTLEAKVKALGLDGGASFLGGGGGGGKLKADSMDAVLRQGTPFTSFTGTKIQMLKRRVAASSCERRQDAAAAVPWSHGPQSNPGNCRAPAYKARHTAAAQGFFNKKYYISVLNNLYILISMYVCICV
jgi:hypothetical protein